MKYPSFLKENDVIGICAPSAGVGQKLQDYENSLSVLKSRHFRILETASVRSDNARSSDAGTRGKEVNELFADGRVDFIMAAAGGDFLDECLPYVDFKLMGEHPKWFMGASDPTGILYPYTTLCDVATIYGLNAGSYSEVPLPDFAAVNLEMIQGKRMKESSYERYMSVPPFSAGHIEYDKASVMDSNHSSFHVKGRCIGGCIDVLKDLIGTRFDGTDAFLKRYREDGFIWYFDNFSLSAEVFYRTLLQMRYAGWLENAKAVLVGRTVLPSSETGMSYTDACRLALSDIPYVTDADIGHTVPHMTMINGALLDVCYARSQMNLTFKLQ